MSLSIFPSELLALSSAGTIQYLCLFHYFKPQELSIKMSYLMCCTLLKQLINDTLGMSAVLHAACLNAH